METFLHLMHVKGVRKMPKGKGTYGSQVGRPPKKQNEDTAGYDIPTSDAGERNQEYALGDYVFPLRTAVRAATGNPDYVFFKGDTVEEKIENIKDDIKDDIGWRPLKQQWQDRSDDIDDLGLGKVGSFTLKYNPMLAPYVAAWRLGDRTLKGAGEAYDDISQHVQGYPDSAQEEEEEVVEPEGISGLETVGGPPIYDAGGRVQQYALGDIVEKYKKGGKVKK